MINVCIVEDEKQSAEKLEELIYRYGLEHDCGFAVTVFDRAERLSDDVVKKFDILFMDIELGSEDGMSASKRIRVRNKDVVIIFVTNVARMAVDGYKIGVLDYIVKPVEKYPLFSALERALIRIARKTDVCVLVDTQGGDVCLRSREITYVEVFGHYLVYHVGRERIKEWAPLNKAESLLSPCGFVRCNKSYLVNLRYVTAADSEFATVAGVKLKIGRTYFKRFLYELNAYLGK
ncbi:MAG: response regulator transcription factor [Clostridia bacterium]|nr:response regulator transcription factor [Clostridia bacterium]